ncbi:MAG: peptidoglycan DD-metalloendopeptidase family protein [Microcoleaceae cyanobacterium]
MTESNDLNQSLESFCANTIQDNSFNIYPTLVASRLSQRSLVVGLSCLTGFGLLSQTATAYEEFSIDTQTYEAVPTEPVEPNWGNSAYDSWQPEPAAVDTYETESYYLEPAESYYSEPTTESYYPEPTEDYYYSEPTTESYYSEPPAVETYETESYYSEPTEDYYYSEPTTESYYSEPTVETPSTLYLPEQREIAPPSDQQLAFPVKQQIEKQFIPNSPPVLPESDYSASEYIDPTDYSIGSTGTYQSPTSVILSERSTGCEMVLGIGENPSSQLCAPTAQPQYNPNGNPVAQIKAPLYAQQTSNETNYAANSNSVWQPIPSTPTYYGGGGGSSYVPVGGFSPVQVGPIYASAMSHSGLTYYNRTTRPPSIPGNGDIALLFPLSIPAPITSLFGWRQHPVIGSSRFHTGMDMGADTGTPVVASYSGKVSVADWLGGYGLTVVLDHQKKSKETLYGHLSELFVKPGETVKQGEVIGRVGNTGMSTGPHLHFELRKLTDQGWVAIDPHNQIEMALAKVLNTLQVAQVPSQGFISSLSQTTKDLETGIPKLPPLPPGFEVTIPSLEPPTLDFGFAETIKPQG